MQLAVTHYYGDNNIIHCAATVITYCKRARAKGEDRHNGPYGYNLRGNNDNDNNEKINK